MKKYAIPLLIALGVGLAGWYLWPEPTNELNLGGPLNLQKLKNDIQTIETDCQTTTGDYCQYLVTGTDYKAVVEVYDGPTGKGYVVTLDQRVGDRIDRTTFNTGSETYRERTTTTICTDYISSTSTDQRICAL